MKVVVTGAPHSGKSTLLAELARRGHRTVPEAALGVIDALTGVAGVLGQAAWRRAWPAAFEELVSRRQRLLEAEAGPGTGTALVFLDRSLVDVLAYSRLLGIEPPAGVRDDIARAGYDRVFLLDLVVPFSARSESGRTSDEARARATHALLLETYRSVGLEPQAIPLAPVTERADRLLAALGE